MKKSVLTLGLALCGTLFAFAQDAAPAAPAPQDNPNAPEIQFESDVIDYGTIDYEANGERVFKFKNTGKEPLVILSTNGSCGCTVPSHPTEAIKPGETGEIHVKYATNRVGPFTKTVTVTSNAKTATKILKIKGTVKAKPEEPGMTPVQDNSHTPVATPDHN
ncbi:MAG: DUF1573 domain-containing protein [Flavobacteriales bacterium]|nr:DUF1573 domain-containing protein [Flavobacteriales bacterium]MCB9447480.1 DUF1573 domain-containing protein [Flavobacteriales bacterium]